MNLGHTPDSLCAFEQRIADRFNSGDIPFPIHLSGGNEQQLIDIFADVEQHDWVLGTWRSHYHALLKGVPEDELESAIAAGRSIALSFPEQRVLCSAIAGGMVPVAVGLGMAIRCAERAERVWCFVGDMVARSGIFYEATEYAWNFRLPVTWVVEDNGVSVVTNTRQAWGSTGEVLDARSEIVRGYPYTLPWPHAGTGKRIEF